MCVWLVLYTHLAIASTVPPKHTPLTSEKTCPKAAAVRVLKPNVTDVTGTQTHQRHDTHDHDYMALLTISRAYQACLPPMVVSTISPACIMTVLSIHPNPTIGTAAFRK